MTSSNKLREKIQNSRQFNTIATLLVLGAMVFCVWLYDYSGLDIPIYVNTVIFIVSLTASPFLVKKANKLTVANCPRCDGIVEKGGFYGQKFPDSCPKCGLLVEARE